MEVPSLLSTGVRCPMCKHKVKWYNKMKQKIINDFELTYISLNLNTDTGEYYYGYGGFIKEEIKWKQEGIQN